MSRRWSRLNNQLLSKKMREETNPGAGNAGHAVGGAMKPESQRSECDISEIGISA